jgi:serine/threonine-protein kinase
MSRHMTEAGLILGTAAYMSPEQARGKAVDKRADIWALGVVIYEMLTGRRLFRGETVSDILAAVLTSDPDWTSLPATTPARLRLLLERCLERDARQRLRDVGEARVALADPSLMLPTPPTAPPLAAPPPVARRAAIAAAVALVVVSAAALSAWAWTRLRPSSPPQPVTRLSISLAPGQVLAGGPPVTVSRDGRRIAYTVRDPDGATRLYVRPLDRFASSIVPDSEGAQLPFFSPEGDRIGFFARGKLRIASVSGGEPVAIADASFQPFGGAWSEDDTIVFVPALSSGLLRVPVSGGTPEPLTTPDEASGGYAHVFPQVLPGGQSVLYTIWGGAPTEVGGGALIPIRGGAPVTRLTQGYWSSQYAASGHLVVSGRGLAASPFDPSNPRAARERTLVVDDVFSSPSSNSSWFSISESGALVYVPGDPNLSTLVWVDRQGTVTPISARPASYSDPSLSPDGTRVVVEGEAYTDLWIVDLRRGTRSRLTAEDERGDYPVWSRDGSRIFFGSNRGGDWDVYAAPATGGAAQRLLARKGTQIPLSEAPDGTLLFSERTAAGTGADLWTLAPDGSAAPLVVSRASKVGGQFSPDGRRVAYVSDESGRDEVYVRAVGRTDETIAVSTDGGRSPRWSPDGRELYYRRGDTFLAVPVSTTGPLSVGDARALFDIHAGVGRSSNHAGYAVAPDGRFLVLRLDPRAIPTQINVVLNWFEELKAKVGAR